MNIQSMLGRLLTISALLVFAISCDSSDNNDPELDLIPINSVTVDGYTVSLEAPNELEIGANQLFWKIKQGDDTITPQSFTISPIMDMATMSHSTPFDQPETDAIDDSYLSNLAVFIMPSGDMGSWTINFQFTTQSGSDISGEMPVNVNSSWKIMNTEDDNGKKYFVTWFEPQRPMSGNNDLTFLVHTRETMMSFPAVSDAELIVYPYMDMGGGTGHSTPFTPPVATGNGFYEGDINYSMSGLWTTTVELVVENDTLPEMVFEYSVIAK